MKQLLIATLLFVTLSAEKCNTDQAGVTGMANVLDTKWVLQSLGENAISMPDGLPSPWLKLMKDGNTLEGNGRYLTIQRGNLFRHFVEVPIAVNMLNLHRAAQQFNGFFQHNA